MKKTIKKIQVILILLLGFSISAQIKKWTIEECVAYALKNNISVKQSELDVKSADIDKSNAIGNFLPTFNGGANHSWNVGLNQNITTGLLVNTTTQYSSVGLNSNLSLYNGLQNHNKLQRAKLSQLSSQYQLSKMQDDISLNVANAYLEILFNRENLKIQQEQLVNDEKQVLRSEELVKAGAVPRGDLLDIKATVASDRQKLVVAENNLMISKLSLAQLLKMEDYQNFDVADVDYGVEQSPVMMQSPEAIVEKAKEVRNEIKIAQTKVDVAEKDIRIARGAFQPSLSGQYGFNTRASYTDVVKGYQLNSTNPTSIIGQVEGTGQNVLQPNFIPVFGHAAPILEQFDKNKGHNFALQLNIPILNGLSVRNNVERNKVNLERSKNALDQAKLDLETNVYKAITNAKGALKSYESAVTTLEARKEAFNYAKEKFTVGMMNAFDFSQSQTVYVAAQSESVRAKYDYIFKVKVVELYFGIPIIQKQ